MQRCSGKKQPWNVQGVRDLDELAELRKGGAHPRSELALAPSGRLLGGATACPTACQPTTFSPPGTFWSLELACCSLARRRASPLSRAPHDASAEHDLKGKSGPPCDSLSCAPVELLVPVSDPAPSSGSGQPVAQAPGSEWAQAGGSGRINWRWYRQVLGVCSLFIAATACFCQTPTTIPSTTNQEQSTPNRERRTPCLSCLTIPPFPLLQPLLACSGNPRLPSPSLPCFQTTQRTNN